MRPLTPAVPQQPGAPSPVAYAQPNMAITKSTKRTSHGLSAAAAAMAESGRSCDSPSCVGALSPRLGQSREPRRPNRRAAPSPRQGRRCVMQLLDGVEARNVRCVQPDAGRPVAAPDPSWRDEHGPPGPAGRACVEQLLTRALPRAWAVPSIAGPRTEPVATGSSAGRFVDRARARRGRWVHRIATPRPPGPHRSGAPNR